MKIPNGGRPIACILWLYITHYGSMIASNVPFIEYAKGLMACIIAYGKMEL